MRLVRTVKEPSVLLPADLEALVPRLASVCSERGVILMYVHGAHARGAQGPLSDLDIAVLLEKDPSRDLKAELDLLASVQEVCGREDVDLVVLNDAGPIIKDRVARHGRSVYARNERDRVLFEAAAIKEALNFRYFSRVYDDALFRQLREGRFLG
jgi:hypothetical protein